jgi:hypothetical protein
MTEAISARLFAQWEGWSRRRGADVHESQVTHHGLPSVRFSVESGDKKKEGVSQKLCLAGQKGDTPCHLRSAD